MRKLLIILLVLLPVVIYLGGGLVNLYWLPVEVRVLLANHKFDINDCIRAQKIWGVNPKRVINYTVKKNVIMYFLQDVDRHEHTQYIEKHIVEKYSEKINCPR